MGAACASSCACRGVRFAGTRKVAGSGGEVGMCSAYMNLVSEEEKKEKEK